MAVWNHIFLFGVPIQKNNLAVLVSVFPSELLSLVTDQFAEFVGRHSAKHDKSKYGSTKGRFEQNYIIEFSKAT